MSVPKPNRPQVSLLTVMHDLQVSAAHLQQVAQELLTLSQQLHHLGMIQSQCFTLLETLLQDECPEDELDSWGSKRLQ